MAWGKGSSKAVVPSVSPKAFSRLAAGESASTWDVPAISTTGRVVVEHGEQLLLQVPGAGVAAQELIGDWKGPYLTISGEDNRNEGRGTTATTHASQLVVTTRRLVYVRNLGADRWTGGHVRWDWLWRIWPVAGPESFEIDMPIKSNRTAEGVPHRWLRVYSDGWSAASMAKFVATVYLDYRIRQGGIHGAQTEVAGAAARLAALDTDFTDTGVKGMTAARCGWHLEGDGGTSRGAPPTHEQGPWPDNPDIGVPADLLAVHERPSRQSPILVRGGSWMCVGYCPPGEPADGAYPAVVTGSRDVTSEDADAAPEMLTFTKFTAFGSGGSRWMHEMHDYRGQITNRGHRLTIVTDPQRGERVKEAPVSGIAMNSLSGALAVDAIGQAAKGGFNLLQRGLDVRRNEGGPILGHIRFDWVERILVGVDRPFIALFYDEQLTDPGAAPQGAWVEIECGGTSVEVVRAFGLRLGAAAARRRLGVLPESRFADGGAHLTALADVATPAPMKVWTPPYRDKLRVDCYELEGAVPIGAASLWGHDGPTEGTRVAHSTPVPAAAVPKTSEDVVASTPSTNPPRWVADPDGRHELRYWDGQRWTEHVSDGGVTSTDAV